MKKLLLLSLLFIGCAESPCGNPVSVKEFNRLQEIKIGLDSLQDLAYDLYDNDGYDIYLYNDERDSLQELVKNLSYWNPKRDELQERVDVIRDSAYYYKFVPASFFEQTIAISFDSIQLIQKCIVTNSSKAYIDFDRAKQYDIDNRFLDDNGKKRFDEDSESYYSLTYIDKKNDSDNPFITEAILKAKELLSEFYNNQ